MRKNHQVRQLLSLWGAAPLYLREWQNDLETFGQLTKQMHTLLAAQTQRRMPQLLESNSAAQTRTQLRRMEAYYLKTAQATQLALQDVLRVRRFVDTLLQMLRPNEYETVAQYYKHGKGWEAIARKLGVSQRQAQRILNGVLEELDLLLDIRRWISCANPSRSEAIWICRFAIPNRRRGCGRFVRRSAAGRGLEAAERTTENHAKGRQNDRVML
jgi:hypothetical protein